jgi:pyruvate,water dikinase
MNPKTSVETPQVSESLNLESPVDTELSERFPVYTRGNAGEVAGMVALPLQQTLVSGMRAEIPWQQGLVRFGAFDEDEFRPGAMDIIGVVGGYIYMNLSVQRVFGVRMPGASAELMDRTYLGSSTGAPPYEPREGDDAPQYTERILASIAQVMSAESFPKLEEAARKAAELRSARPDYSSMTSQQLLDYSNKVAEEYAYEYLTQHMTNMYESSVVTGMLENALAQFDDSTLAVRLMGGWGGIASVAPSVAMWDLSRQIVESPRLRELFEQGTADLYERLQASAESDVQTFTDAFENFLVEHGSRSTNEWDALPHTWETHPEIALGLIDRMRLLDADRDPRVTSVRIGEEREELSAQLRERLTDDPEALQTLETALRAMSVWMPARELSKTNYIKVLHEVRLPLYEIGQRLVASGHLDEIDDLALLRLDEIEEFIDTPEVLTAKIPERKEWKRRMEELEPPFVVTQGQIPPISQWAKRSAPATLPTAEPGDILTGLGACSGAVTGVARVITSPTEAQELEPGEILVAPETDPGWTPLFTSCSAVVVNVGSPLSHAAIISRELGIPAVLGIEQATKRIRNGTTITVDGTAGTVTIH